MFPPNPPVPSAREKLHKSVAQIREVFSRTRVEPFGRSAKFDEFRRVAAEPVCALAQILRDEGDDAGAAGLYAFALSIHPKSVAALTGMGIIATDRSDAAAALRHFQAALALAPTNVELLTAYARFCSLSQHEKEACDALETARHADPDNRAVLINLHAAASHVGRFDLARSCIDRMLELDPGDGHARWLLSFDSTFKTDDPAIQAIETAFAQSEGESRMFLGFSLFRAFDQTGRHPEAFASLEEANRIRRSQLQFSIEQAERRLAGMAELFTAERIAGLAGMGYRDQAPIFIVGLPRSGSSLTEQILSSHPDVAGVGEIALAKSLLSGFVKDSREDLRGEELFDAGKAAEVGRLYCERLAQLTRSAPRTVDKNLFNFEMIGLIRTVLPNARIVHCTRDPLAVCLANYSIHFQNPAIGFVYDQSELGRYYVAYRRLMDHWNMLYRDAIYELSYERLTENPEHETRSLLSYCGLDWNPACLNFHLSGKSVRTTSAAQVRKPLYSGVDRKSRHYRRQLDPLIAVIEAAGYSTGSMFS